LPHPITGTEVEAQFEYARSHAFYSREVASLKPEDCKGDPRPRCRVKLLAPPRKGGKASSVYVFKKLAHTT